jgi:ribonuclease Y
MGIDTVLAIFFSFIIGAVFGGMAMFILKGTAFNRQSGAAQKKADTIISEAQSEARALVKEAREVLENERVVLEREIQERRNELQRRETTLAQKETTLEHKLNDLAQKEKTLSAKEKEMEQLRASLEEIKSRQAGELERVARMTTEEARNIILERLEGELAQEKVERLHRWEAELRAEANRKAQEIIVQAIQRSASEVATETTVSVVPLPNDEMKGRLIGREGRNIRAIEQATGVDLIIDDTPEAVTLSSFDPIRREIARQAITKLVLDGRIHPARIEEVVAKAKNEVEEEIEKAGEEAAFEAGVRGLHPELIKILGRLKYRTSYGQNVLAHSIEVALLASKMAAELKLNVNLAKRAGLLHDIGKAVDREVEGTHAAIGAEIVRQREKSPEVVKGIAEHHLDTENISIWGFLISAADAISSSRPGARREDIENYVKRLRDLEEIADSFAGVAKSYAIQAGREIRIMVRPTEVDDLKAVQMARDIAQKIEETLQYPGQIKVTVLREIRAVDYAK